MRAPELDEDEEQIVFNWIDEQELSRPKRNIHRDFSDGVLVSEIIHNHFPKLIEIHNYSSVSSKSDKYNNWVMLNKKVLNKMKFQIHSDDITDIVNATPGVIESVLRQIQLKIGWLKMENEETSKD